MLKYCLLFVLALGQVFAAGLKPSFDLSFNVRKLSVSNHYEGDYSDTYTSINLNTTLPYSKVVGLTVELMALSFYNDYNIFNIGAGGGFSSLWGFGSFSTKIGLIELIPSMKVAPFFKQFFTIDRIGGADSDITSTYIGLGFGVEFNGSSKVRPLVEGHVSRGSIDTFREDFTNFGIGAGVKLEL